MTGKSAGEMVFWKRTNDYHSTMYTRWAAWIIKLVEEAILAEPAIGGQCFLAFAVLELPSKLSNDKILYR